MTTLLLSAGDASGDLHAAALVRAFHARHPDARFVGLGGPAMEAAGVELVADQRDLAVGGLFELAGSLSRVVSTWRRLARALARERPDLVVLVDSGGFNLPFARHAKRRTGAPILYFVAPQVWAWRTGRIKKLERRVDRLAVIFPFEPAVYAQTRLRVDFVGHPLVDELAEVTLDLEAARRSCGVAPSGPLVTLLPGSRRNEVKRHLPVQLTTARLLFEADPKLRFLLAVAPSLAGALLGGPGGEIAAASREAGLPDDFPLTVLPGRAREAIRAADVVLAKPGTVTVEATLLARPMVVMGRAHPLTAWILRRAIRVPSLTMPNLIAENAIVPEFLQEDADPERLAAAVAALMEGPARDAQLAGLACVRARLGTGGAVDRACRIAEEMLEAAGT